MIQLCLALALEEKRSDPIKVLRTTLEKRAASYKPFFRKM
jgi:hypothetical protein